MTSSSPSTLILATRISVNNLANLLKKFKYAYLFSAQNPSNFDPGSVGIFVLIDKVFNSAPGCFHHLHRLLIELPGDTETSKLLELADGMIQLLKGAQLMAFMFLHVSILSQIVFC